MAATRKRPTKAAATSMSETPAMSTYSSSYSSESPSYSLPSVATAISNNFGLLFVMGLVFVAGFFVGSIWTEKELLKNGKGAPVAAAPAAPTAPTADAGPTPDQLKKAPAVTNEDWMRGNKNAKVTLIEYSDFECPFCARFHPTAQQIIKEYGDKIRFVYRHYPLSFHPNAQKAAEASECVAKQKGQDGFWAFTDAIFEENNKAGGRLSPEIIAKVAEGTGVNMTTYKSCLDSGEMAEKVKQQMAGGSLAGISGTPGTIILSGDTADLIPGAVPFEQVKGMLDPLVN
jgi:protein-disulfide isomerase